MKKTEEQIGKPRIYEVLFAGYCAIVAALVLAAIVYMVFFQK
jgi:hypothetical protein